MQSFRETLLSREKFVVTLELIPGRGPRGRGIDTILSFAEKAAESGLLGAISLTDNPGGGPAMSPDLIGKEVRDAGVDVIVHFSAKDGNRNRLESRALSLDRMGLDNLLVMTGDYPIAADAGIGKPVFDLDSTQLLAYLKRMNEGMPVPEKPDKPALTGPTAFFLGCVASSFKTTEPETMMQYYKLEKKIRVGAEYVICQLGYDTRKYEEMLAYMRENGLDIPVMGSVFYLRRGAARVMNRCEVPGCVVSDELAAQIEKEREAPDKGKGAAIERAAQQIAILKGLGFNGAHIEGFGLSFGDVETIIGRSKELEANWQEHAERIRFSPKNTFFLYGGNGNPPAPRPPFRPRRSNIVFHTMRAVHYLIFRKKTPGFAFMRALSSWLDGHPLFLKLFYFSERASKVLLFDCRDCGDCALPEMFYLCPESQCPKFQRVGPCGGGRDGRCEVYDDRFCVWYEIYLRAKRTGKLDELRRFFIAPRDWDLHATSSWINFYLDRDHTGGETDG